MKVVILAAGAGNRMLPLTFHKPKCMIKIVGKPILGYQIEGIMSAGIKDLIIVTGYKYEQIENYCKAIKNINITLIKNNDFKIIKDTVWTDEKTLTLFIIELETNTLPRIKKSIGPPLEFEEECNSFISKYANNPSLISGPYIQNKRWIILKKRSHFKKTSETLCGS